MVGIVDEALAEGADDALKISSYKEALVNFVSKTNTPMTIGVQGEWGSGKTSLLNQIWSGLEHLNQNDGSISDFKQIWINSWEHSLLCSPEECLMKIINEIILEIASSDISKHRTDSLKKSINTIMKGALRIGSSVALGTAGVDAVDSVFSDDKNSIKELRNQLKELISDLRKLESNNYGKIVIYIDDLDRIDPKDAVSILELLKNIFNIKDCVFVLAIDYQVVVKGLEGKFGKPTQDNEWEFRAFFDKIIQLPFSMPMGKYDIANYVLGLLEEINFYTGDEDLDSELINQFVTKTIGGNPRSIKRLVNSLALISMLNDIEKSETSSGLSKDKNSSMVLFAMVCLQIAHPEIYQLFVDRPNYKDWDEELAYRETQKIEEMDENWEKNYAQAKETDNFDEEWERCLFRICYPNKRTRKRVIDVSQFISLFDEEFDKNIDIVKLIETALGQTAVTNVSSKESANVRPPKGSGKRHYVTGFDAWISNIREKYLPPDKYPNFPETETENAIKEYIKVFKSNPYNAVDFDKTKGMDQQGSDFVIKYTGIISLYYKKKKIIGVNIVYNKGVENIELQAMKHPKHQNKALILKKSQITFNHFRSIREIDVENRNFKGSNQRIDLMSANFLPKVVTVKKELLQILIDDSVEVKTNQDMISKALTPQLVEGYIEAFKNSNKNSNDFKEAVKFLNTYYEDSNKKEIDL